MEPPWQTKMVSIKQDENIRYTAAMFVWFQHWKVSGSWPSLPRCNFVLEQEISDTFNSCLAPTLAKLDPSLGELQALKVLTTLQCLAERGPWKLAPGYTCQCVVNHETSDSDRHCFHTPSSLSCTCQHGQEAPH